MQSYIEWALALPYTIKVPVYLLIGVLIGINYRFFVARHVWKKHQQENRPDSGNCWCKDSSYHPFISFGDFVAFATWSSPITWPIHLPIAILVLCCIAYAKILRFFYLLGQRGALRTFAHFGDEAALRKELERITKLYEGEQRERARYAGLRDECEKTIGSLRNEVSQLKAKKPEDIRFEELMDKSAKLLDRQDERMPGEISCPFCKQPFTPVGGSISCTACKKG